MLDKLFNFPKINMRALVIVCYTAGAGAIGFFMRWIQKQIAFTDDNLVDPSFWNVMLPFYMLICAYLAYNHIRNLYEDGFSVPSELNEALYNKSMLVKVLSGLFAFVFVVGGILLIASCEADKNAFLLRCTGILGIAAGICQPLLLLEAGKGEPKMRLCCLLSFIPMLFYCVWLIASYKTNDINPVVWSYSIEILTVCICIMAYFRIAGFSFAAAKGKRAVFYCMAAFYMCFMSLADSRYMGMQLMIIATAGMMLLQLWLLIENLMFVPPALVEFDDGGFENLNSRKKRRR